MKQVSYDHTLAASKILSDAQMKRLWEITLQLEGLMAACHPEVQDRLNLSPSQRLSIDQVKIKFESKRKSTLDQ